MAGNDCRVRLELLRHQGEAGLAQGRWGDPGHAGGRGQRTLLPLATVILNQLRVLLLLLPDLQRQARVSFTQHVYQARHQLRGTARSSHRGGSEVGQRCKGFA